MATYTTNLNLKKPAQSDKIRIADINNNMDDIDAAFGAIGNDSVATQMGNIQDALAIVAVGDSHAAVTAGQFVYVKSHETLDAGLYVASANIAENGALSLSNLTADSSGGLNALNTHINNKTLTRTGLTIDPTFDSAGGGYCRIGQFVLVQMRLNKAAAYSIASGSTIVSGFPPALDTAVYLTPSANISNSEMYIDTSGNLKNQNTISSDRTMFVSGMYLAST